MTYSATEAGKAGTEQPIADQVLASRVRSAWDGLSRAIKDARDAGLEVVTIDNEPVSIVRVMRHEL